LRTPRTWTTPDTLHEVLVALKSFSKDKIPGLDGWTIEFYLHLFDLVGTKLLELVEDSKIHGKVSGELNSTFLNLIQKLNLLINFGDYRPIALCNLCYNLISKIITNIIKPILSRSLVRRIVRFFKGPKNP
jgi:hypothetical protein